MLQRQSQIDVLNFPDPLHEVSATTDSLGAYRMKAVRHVVSRLKNFGWMSRDFYLEEHDPARWPVKTSASAAQSQAARTEGLTDAG